MENQELVVVLLLQLCFLSIFYVVYFVNICMFLHNMFIVLFEFVGGWSSCHVEWRSQEPVCGN